MTIKEVAREAGVSTATISRVLNNKGYMSADIREKVLKTVEKMNYQPNSIARSLKQDKSRSIGLVLPDMTNPYFMQMARQIQRKCLGAGYHLLIMDTEEDSSKEKESLNFLLEQRVEGIVLAGTGENVDKISKITVSGIQVILIDRQIKGLNLDVVAEDNEAIAENAITYLLEKGHQQIGIISGPPTVITAKERWSGAINAFEKAGKSMNPSFVYEGDFTRRSGIEGIKRLMKLEPQPTAVFSLNNEMTYGLYLGLQELGVELDSIEVVSIGDLEFSSLFKQKLTVIMQRPDEIGGIAGDLIFSRLKNEEKSIDKKILMPEMVKK
ncbi:LacI family DNA-binding transcriptional regulator [Bacillus sp. NEB1478]|uniref:LacI family DNA-binding transcriptional regulator n=1 Tax=Bacillus sp. NEB1478 TaxID=3073816 RepID=UPI002873D31E|nr:LacI family DNA-binding transcriptional regulator [Bacillus sp. NEB1478]WNB94005.1 LacI family DNA-binding transcriptional regulator [Bacillus sp. NEB1478]